MLIDKIAKLAGKAVRGVTLTVGTVSGTIYDEIKSVPSAFIDGLTAGQGLVKKQQEPKTEATLSVNTSNVPKDDNNNSIFKH
jgi:hypothetical protein